MKLRSSAVFSLLVLTGLTLSAVSPLRAQDGDAPQRHGRKYKAPPLTSHIEVMVRKASNGKPIPNAAVVFRAMMDGKDEGNLEVKTDPDGKAIIDVIQTGSDLRVQVIANGFATYGAMYKVDGPTKSIDVAMESPRAQVSAYAPDNDKASQRKAGVQEPARPTQPAPANTAPAAPQNP